MEGSSLWDHLTLISPSTARSARPTWPSSDNKIYILTRTQHCREMQTNVARSPRHYTPVAFRLTYVTPVPPPRPHHHHYPLTDNKRPRWTSPISTLPLKVLPSTSSSSHPPSAPLHPIYRFPHLRLPLHHHLSPPPPICCSPPLRSLATSYQPPPLSSSSSPSSSNCSCCDCVWGKGC